METKYLDFLFNNLQYCEDTHSIAHRFYNELRDAFIDIVNKEGSIIDNGKTFFMTKELFEKHFNYKDAQFIMSKVIVDMDKEYTEYQHDNQTKL